MTDRTTPHASSGLRMAIDYGPLVVFFAVNFFAPVALTMRLVGASTGFMSDIDRVSALVIAKVIAATTAFIIATVIAMIVSKIKWGNVSPMLWISGGLVVVFGGLTIYFHDPKFIQMKPTIVYAMFGAILAFGLATGRPLLQQLLEATYPGLNALGWRKLTRNWAVFFVGMALLNEFVWRYTLATLGKDAGWNFWVGFKLWGAIPLTLLFAFANVPMLMRHGLTVEGVPVTDLPPEG